MRTNKGNAHEVAGHSMSCLGSMDDVLFGAESRVKEEAQMSKCVDHLPELVKYAVNIF